MQSSQRSCTVLQPGLVHIHNALTQAQQEFLVEIALQEGERKQGFYEYGKLNSTKTRGRIYNSLQSFPPGLDRLCLAQVAQACAEDAAMPAMTPTHLLLLKYTTEKGMGYHRDNSENDGAGAFPVVSLSIGNACVFSVKHKRDSLATNITLHSGDAILFGGPCREILHAVTEVHRGTSPFWLPSIFQDVRLNFTFRHAPEILGREQEFEFFRPAIVSKHDARKSADLDSQHATEGVVVQRRRLCPLDGKAYTQEQFAKRHGQNWEQVWKSAIQGPAASSEVAEAVAALTLQEHTVSSSMIETLAIDERSNSNKPVRHQRWARKK